MGIDVDLIAARGERFDRTALTDAERALIGGHPRRRAVAGGLGVAVALLFLLFTQGPAEGAGRPGSGV